MGDIRSLEFTNRRNSRIHASVALYAHAARLGQAIPYIEGLVLQPLANSEKPGFSGHETFPFRYGWLRKALIGTEVSSQFFARPLALVTLGVGKNMVQSIRHWGLATRILEDVSRSEVAPTPLGQRLLQDWDPYLEDIGSLWLVHWWLVGNPARAATWHYVFFRWSRQEFSKGELTDHLLEWAERASVRATRSSIERDVDCMLRTYLPGKSSKKGLSEESFDCPLVELGLLRPLQDGDRYTFVTGPKRTLPAAIFGYALVEYINAVRGDRRTVALHDALYGVGSPGLAFKLSENALVELVEAVQALTGGAIELDDTAGLKQLYLREELDSADLLARFYEETA